MKNMLKKRKGADGMQVLIMVIIAVVIIALSFWAVSSGKGKVTDMAKDSETKAATIESTDAFN